MNNQKKLIKKYLAVPGWIKLMIILSVISLFGCIIIAGSDTGIRLVNNSEKKDYTDYYGLHMNAGDKVFLNVTGISQEPAYSTSTKDYYIVLDEGIEENDDWYYYLVSMTSEVHTDMQKQIAYFNETTDEAVPYTLYGVTVVPSDAVIEGIMAAYELTDEEYATLLGRTFLLVNEPVTPIQLHLGIFGIILSILMFITGIILLLQNTQRRNRTIKAMAQQGYLEEAAAELESATFSKDDPLFTASFLFNRSACTVTKLQDIWMVYKNNGKLIGLSKYNIVCPLAGNDNNGIQDEIINRIKEVNPQLLIGNTDENKMAFEKMLLERKDDLE